MIAACAKCNKPVTALRSIAGLAYECACGHRGLVQGAAIATPRTKPQEARRERFRVVKAIGVEGAPSVGTEVSAFVFVTGRTEGGTVQLSVTLEEFRRCFVEVEG